MTKRTVKVGTKPATPVVGIDPRSDVVVLSYEGGPLPWHVPARDLHGGDLARVLYLRALVADSETPPEPATPDDLDALVEELIASASFAFARGASEPVAGEHGEEAVAVLGAPLPIDVPTESPAEPAADEEAPAP